MTTLIALLLAAQDPAALLSEALKLAGENPAQAEQLWQQALQASPGYFPALFNYA